MRVVLWRNKRVLRYIITATTADMADDLAWGAARADCIRTACDSLLQAAAMKNAQYLQPPEARARCSADDDEYEVPELQPTVVMKFDEDDGEAAKPKAGVRLAPGIA